MRKVLYKVVGSIVGILLLFFVLVPYMKRSLNKTYEGFSEKHPSLRIQDKVSGTVTIVDDKAYGLIKGHGAAVELGSGQRYYLDVNKEIYMNKYIFTYIEAGDSLYKKPGNDTLTLIKSGNTEANIYQFVIDNE